MSLSLDASTPTEHDAVHFPSRNLADFVIHYESTNFFVHKFVLQHHSGYFRVYFMTLPTTSPMTSSPSLSSATTIAAAQPTANKLTLTLKDTDEAGIEKPAPKRPKRCDHPHIAHCIHLPQQTMLVEQEVVTADDFCLFLKHLYYSAHYNLAPLLPKTDVDITDDSAGVSIHFPEFLFLDDKLPLHCVGKDAAHNESLLALAHYLDCAQMLRRTEMVMYIHIGCSTKQAWRTREGSFWLQYAHRYQMRRWRKTCIRAIADSDKHVKCETYKQERERWSDELRQKVDAAIAAGVRRRELARNCKGSLKGCHQCWVEHDRFKCRRCKRRAMKTALWRLEHSDDSEDSWRENQVDSESELADNTESESE